METNFLEFFAPTRVLAGAGLVESLGQEVSRLGWSRCFIVTDSFMRESGQLERVLAGLRSGPVEVAGIFDEAVPDSEVSIVERCAKRAGEASPDCILALGGGSVIDTAKAANILLTLGGELLDYEGFGLIDSPLTPLLAIPTTAGSGSEVTQFAVIKHQARQAKLSFFSPYLVPSAAVLDPEMTVSLPPSLTATTGMDALTHAIEAHLSTSANPIASGLALQAVRLIFTYLPRAVHEGYDPGARQAMLLAASMAGMAFSSTMVGVVHAAAHACGGLYGVPHGLANAILLPHGMLYNLQVAAAKLADIAHAAGTRETGLSHEEYGRKAVAAVEQLCAQCGLQQRLKDTGLPRDGLAAVAELAAVDGAVFTNPRPAEADDILKLLEDAYE
ncbi:MAG: iron-containing alcohol dehydrogenase [Bacillota bacterium]|nr:iron-containing alcohol dehydrogenase [Bacillota bacterium]MDW7683291.1 iron-containing alcohol dehydrogenase [Bacillota bacterium]